MASGADLGTVAGAIMTSSRFAAAVYCAAFIAASCGSSAHAIDGYWRGDVNNDWNTGIVEDESNWYEQAGGMGSLRNVPDLSAKFAAGARTTSVVIREDTRIGEIVFEASAPVYLLRIGGELTIPAGMENQSDKTPLLRVGSASGGITLEGIARIESADASVRAVEITTSNLGRLRFLDSSRGGNAIVTNTREGTTFFEGESSAERMEITNRTGGAVYFDQTATGDRADIINDATGELHCRKTGTAELALGRLGNNGLANLGRCSLKLARSYSQGASGELRLRILGAAHFGKIETTLSAIVGGALHIEITAGVPVPGTFTIVKAGGRRTGSFASLTITGRNDVKGRLAYSPTEVRLFIEPK
jgi:hypothetical protein